jgi:hypothetical protein
MDDPVLLMQSGQTYDRKHLMKALIHHPGVDPATNIKFSDKPNVVSNYALKSLIDKWKTRHGIVPSPVQPMGVVETINLGAEDKEGSSIDLLNTSLSNTDYPAELTGEALKRKEEAIINTLIARRNFKAAAQHQDYVRYIEIELISSLDYQMKCALIHKDYQLCDKLTDMLSLKMKSFPKTLEDFANYEVKRCICKYIQRHIMSPY